METVTVETVTVRSNAGAMVVVVALCCAERLALGSACCLDADLLLSVHSWLDCAEQPLNLVCCHGPAFDNLVWSLVASGCRFVLPHYGSQLVAWGTVPLLPELEGPVRGTFFWLD